MYVCHMCDRYLQRSEEFIGIPGAEATDGAENLGLDPLQDDQILLTTELSLPRD